MFFLKSVVFLVVTVSVFCETDFVETLGKCIISDGDCKSIITNITTIGVKELGILDSLGKCGINDGDCQKDLMQSIILNIATDGIKGLGIPPVDPLELKNVSVSVLNVIDFTMIDGVGKGIKNCKVQRFFTNVEEERAFVELKCDISVKGHYKVFSNSPIIKSFTGGETLEGEGNGKVKIEKLFLRFDFDFFVQKRDGEIYLKCKKDALKYTYNIGKMVFAADKLYIGKQESSKLVTRLLNENWRLLLSTFGKPVLDKAMDIVYQFLHVFFEMVPAKHFISDDLSKYAREQP